MISSGLDILILEFGITYKICLRIRFVFTCNIRSTTILFSIIYPPGYLLRRFLVNTYILETKKMLNRYVVWTWIEGKINLTITFIELVIIIIRCLASLASFWKANYPCTEFFALDLIWTESAMTQVLPDRILYDLKSGKLIILNINKVAEVIIFSFLLQGQNCCCEVLMESFNLDN